MIQKINLQQQLHKINGYWNPHITGELNGQHVKLVKIKGEFIWHAHQEEDEMFLVLEGTFDMVLRDQTINLSKGDFIIIPRGIEHKPVAAEEAHILLFEPVSTLNTGNAPENSFTKNKLKSL